MGSIGYGKILNEPIFLRTRFRAPHLRVVVIYFHLSYDFNYTGREGLFLSIFFGIHSFDKLATALSACY